MRLFLGTLCATLAVTALCGKNSECIEDKDDGLCSTNLDAHNFQPPNELIPADVRGVYWIDAGPDAPGYTNPWVDLNFLQPFPEGSRKKGKFWVMDR